MSIRDDLSTSSVLGPNATPTTSDPLTTIVALSCVALAGFDLRLIGGVSAAAAVLVVTVPLWWRAFVDTEFAVWITAATGAAVVAGLQLAASIGPDHAVNVGAQRATILHLGAGIAAMIALLWGRSLVPLHTVALVYGSAALADALLYSPRSWKFDLALPTAIIVVGWLGRARSGAPAVVALVVIGLLSALDEGRSFFALCVLAAAVTMWQSRPTSTALGRHRWYPAILLAGLGAAIYAIATKLLVAGYLGVGAQQRTVSQIERSGSLISGGRPEWAASVALFRERPLGYGIGVVPNTRDYSVARSGLDAVNLDAGGYLRNYMLGGGFRLHSVAADLWVGFGLLGLVLAGLIAFALVRTMSSLVAVRRCPPLVALAVVLAIWNLLFGPIYSNWPDVMFALGVTLLPRGALAARTPRGDPVSEPQGS